MKSRALAEVESDLNKTFRRIAGCFDVSDPDSETWLTLKRLAERLQEEAGRAYHYAKTAETLKKMQDDSTMTPPTEKEYR